jgi:hypothetical protein
MSEGAHIVSTLSRRFGAHVRRTILASALAALVLAVCALPAFAVAPTVHIRIEGGSGMLFDGTRAVGATSFTDSSGTSYNVTSAPTPLSALAQVSRTSGLSFFVKDYGTAIFVDSVNGELPGPGPDFDGWMFRVNGSETAPGHPSAYYSADSARLHPGDNVLWYYGAWYAVPTALSVSSHDVAVGTTLTVTAKQLDEHGVATPLEGAAVHVGSMTATSSADGTARFGITSSGDVGVRVEKAGCIRSAIETVHVRKSTGITGVKASATDVEVGAAPVISGVLRSGSAKLAAKNVRVESRATNSKKWVAGQTKLTGLTGAVRFSVRPRRSSYYRIVFAGNGTYMPVMSSRVLVKIR